MSVSITSKPVTLPMVDSRKKIESSRDMQFDKAQTSEMNKLTPMESEPKAPSIQTKEIAIMPGPTPGHNVMEITDPSTGVVNKIPPNSASAIYALAQRLAKLMHS